LDETTVVVCPECGWVYHAEVKNQGEWEGVYLPIGCPECGEEFEWEVKDGNT